MTGTSHREPTVGGTLRRTLVTSLGALQNRGELFLVELEEEKTRLVTMLLWGVGALFLGMMTVLLLTGTILFLVPENYRLYVAAGFTVLYLSVTLWAVFSLKAILKQIPFDETLAQIRKDRELLESL